MEQATYDAYTKVAAFFNRSVADLMRESLESGVTVMETLGAIIDEANAGNKDAAAKLFDAFWRMMRGELDLAELSTSATLAGANVAQNGGQD